MNAEATACHALGLTKPLTIWLLMVRDGNTGAFISDVFTSEDEAFTCLIDYIEENWPDDVLTFEERRMNLGRDELIDEYFDGSNEDWSMSSATVQVPLSLFAEYLQCPTS